MSKHEFTKPGAPGEAAAAAGVFLQGLRRAGYTLPLRGRPGEGQFIIEAIPHGFCVTVNPRPGAKLEAAA